MKVFSGIVHTLHSNIDFHMICLSELSNVLASYDSLLSCLHRNRQLPRDVRFSREVSRASTIIMIVIRLVYGRMSLTTPRCTLTSHATAPWLVQLNRVIENESAHSWVIIGSSTINCKRHFYIIQLISKHLGLNRAVVKLLIKHAPCGWARLPPSVQLPLTL